MKTLWAEQALTSNGWQSNVLVRINENGLITDVESQSELTHKPAAHRYPLLLPAPANLHSHAFQRAMSGLTEKRARDKDSFWSWRELMYRFVGKIAPEDLQSIAALVQMEMLEAGFASVAEFHYLHNQANGTPYDNPAEMSERVIAAAHQTGIGLCLLPVLYQQANCEGKALSPDQQRFAKTVDEFADMHARAQKAITGLTADACIGVAPHSLRAVSEDALRAVVAIQESRPIHIHIAEQQAEIDEVSAFYAARPVEWLLSQFHVDSRWCLIHATHMKPYETAGLAKSGATAGLCPITEANLGDGIFNGQSFFANNGSFGVGSDSNVRISLNEELRMLEYSQRLKTQNRVIFATGDKSCGRVLLEHSALGGARALGRKTGSIEVGNYADLLSLDINNIDLQGKKGDELLDSFIFSGGDNLVTDVWAAGRHLVRNGKHIHHEQISSAYRETISQLREKI